MNYKELSKVADSATKFKDSENPLIKYVDMAMAPDGDCVSVDIEDLGVDAINQEWIDEAKKYAEEILPGNLILEYCDGDEEAFTIETFFNDDYLNEDDAEEVEDSVKVKDSFSPQMYELIEGFENMPDDVDEVEVKTSSEVPQDEIDEFVNLYMSHYPEGEEEFKLTIEPLGGNLYKIKCPLA